MLNKTALQRLAMTLIAVLLLNFGRPASGWVELPAGPPAPETGSTAGSEIAPASIAAPAAATTPIFRYPVVPGVVISGYFDHSAPSGWVTWYNGMKNNSPSYGYYFSCSTPYMYDFVGCADDVAGEPACPNYREVWYDGHHGTDYEFAANWHTGAVCDPDRFTGITMPIYSPAAGRVQFAGYDASRPGNGWHIRIKHDLNGNGSFEDDNLRSNYLHFTANALAVQTNQLVSEGQYLGLGGSTGYSSSPHLHFEIQRSSDNFSTTVWSVDPYGWSGPGTDPWPYQNDVLWRYPQNYDHLIHLPLIANRSSTSTVCPGCGELLDNNGFESGPADWVTIGVDIITNTSDPSLPVSPYAGSWLGWLGGRNSAADTLYQTFQVPTGLAGARLSYYVMITTAETGGVYDRFWVRLRTSGGDLIQQLDYLDNTSTPANQWMRREIDIPALLARQGELLRVSFEATTDSSLVTNFYVDEVYLEALNP